MPADQSERDRAIATKENVSVTAGAGTGKTTLLVSKVLHKVLDEGLDIRRILALTFTEKAANEMRLRIEDELGKSDHPRAEAALAGLDRAEIGTIHSFCAHILREFPLEAGVAPDFRVDEKRHARRLFEREWPKWLDAELAAKSPRRKAWLEVLARLEIRDLRETARALSSFSIPEEALEATRGRELLDRYLREAPPSKSREKLVGEAARVDDALMAAVRSLLAPFARAFRDTYRREGFVSFEAMLSLARDLLLSTAFPGPREILTKKYRFILVDEFQDTDPVQGEIILCLAGDEPGKLFIVGDPKQSIYSFRGADIVAYKQVCDRIPEKVILRTNFRSHRGIIDLVNATFREVIRERPPLQPPYEAIEPEEGRESGPGVELHVITPAPGKKLHADEAREAEAEIIADWIASRAGKTPHRDIAILLRALTNVSFYLEALRARGIPFVVEGEKLYFRTIEVIDFINLLRAIANPFDRIALVGVLRSPLGAQPDDEIYRLKRAGSLDYRRDGPEPLYGLLRSWHGRAGRLSVPALIGAIFEESPVLELASRGLHGEQAVANLLKLRQRAFELEAEGGVTLAEFLSGAREAVRDVEEEGESPLADETLDAVRILSVHKSKGLEFPVVILPDLHRRPSGGREPSPVRYDWPTRTLGLRIGGEFDSGGAALAWLERERRLEEDRRLFYVAMTRARETLVMSGSVDAPSESYLDLLRSAVPGGKLYAVREHVHAVPSPPPREERGAPPAQDWAPFVARWRERERRAESARVARFTSPSRLEEKERPRPDEGDLPRVSRAAEIGIACHKILEELDFSNPSVPETADPEAAEILRAFFASPAFREIASTEILARELPFLMPHGDSILQGVIDVVYRSGDGVVVADYKTDRAVHPEEYRLARDLYVRAVERTLGLKVAAFKLFYLRHGRVVTL